jgi:hypothetical protein
MPDYIFSVRNINNNNFFNNNVDTNVHYLMVPDDARTTTASNINSINQ